MKRLFARWLGRAPESGGAARATPAPDARLLALRFEALGALAAADGAPSAAEQARAESFLARDRLDARQRALALGAFARGCGHEAMHGADLCAAILALRTGPATLGGLLDDLLLVALADGPLRDAERAWLLAFARRLNMDASGIELRLRMLAAADDD
jgi:hypothetical protein